MFGYLLSWFNDMVFGQITSVTPTSGGKAIAHDRINLSGLGDSSWFGLPSGKLANGVSLDRC